MRSDGGYTAKYETGGYKLVCFDFWPFLWGECYSVKSDISHVQEEVERPTCILYYLVFTLSDCERDR